MPGEIRARVPGGGITGWLAGAGPPVLVLHGGPGLSDYTAPLAAELEDAFGVIRYQQGGLAPSATSGPFDIGRHVADAIAVLDAAGAARAYLIGHSWAVTWPCTWPSGTPTGCSAWCWSTRSERSPTVA